MADSFTYEDIYELLRIEKFSAELQKISDDELKKINEYLKVKEKTASQEENMSSAKKVKILTEIENAHRTLSDLYEKRERKVINRAIVTIRSDNMLRDTTNMLEFEIKLYNEMIKVLEDNKREFFNTLHVVGDNGDILEKEMQDLDEMKREMNIEEIQNNTKKIGVEFIESSEQFYGEDLKTYGPYSRGEKAELPEKIANLLRDQKKLKILNKNESPKINEDILPEVQKKDGVQSDSSEK